MGDVRAHDIDTQQPSADATEGEDISDQRGVLPSSDQPDSPTSPTETCAGLSNPFEESSLNEDGYLGDGNDTLRTFH